MARLSVAFMAALLTMTAGERPAEDHKFGALNVHGDGSEGTKAIGGETTVKINFLLTRHALSCANAVKYFPSASAYSFYHARVQDPLLTACGARRSSELRTETSKLKPDYVLSSHLLRAMETAVLMYDVADGRQVTPVPYVSEEGMGYDNTRFTLAKQQQIVDGKRYAINWEWMKQPSYKEATSPDWGKFLQFMASKFLPKVAKGQDLTIAVVTHSVLMKSILEWVDKEITERAKKLATDNGAAEGPCKAAFGAEPELKNNQVVKVAFNYMTVAKTLTLQGGCEKLFDDQIKDRPKTLCHRDVGCADADAWIKNETTVNCCVDEA